MTARIRIRRALHANWNTDNPTLDHGEIGLSYNGTVCVGFKVGNGTTAWNSLPLFKPPQVNEGGTEHDSNILWADVARLAGDNTFTDGVHIFGPTEIPDDQTPLTVKGKLTVTESSSSAADGDLTVSAGDVAVTTGDVTVSAGDVTVTAGDIIVPEYNATTDTNVIRGASGKGGLFLSATGPFLGYGVDAGDAQSSTPGTYGPFIKVNSNKVVVGGHDGASSSTANQTTLEYGLQPENATLAGLSSDLIVPTRKQVVDHVAAERWMLNSFDPPSAGWTWEALTKNTLHNLNLYSHRVGDLLPAGVTSGVTHLQIMASAEEGDGYCTVAAGKQSIGLAINPTNYVIKGVAVAGVGPTSGGDHDRNQSTALVPIDANGDFSVKAFDSGNHSYEAQFTVIGYCK